MPAIEKFSVLPHLRAILYGIANEKFMFLKLFTIAGLLLLMAATLSGQSYYFRHYQVEHGLSNNAVICSIQDAQGFMWFGTKDGLNRFNGYAFKTFRSQPDDTGSIGSHFIHCLYQDASGTLWVGTENGLYCYDASTESFALLPTTGGGQIRDIISDGQNLWFISGFTLAKHNYASRQQQYFDIAQYFEATSICTTRDGVLWASTPTGLLKKYDRTTNTFTGYDVFGHSRLAVSRWIEKIYATTGHSILVGTSNQGVKIFDSNTSAYRDVVMGNPGITEMFVRNFLQTAPYEYWIATESGIFIFNTETNTLTNLCKKTNDPYSLSDNAVYTFCKDKEGGIWAGTYFGGVNYYPKQYNTFTKYFPRAGENSISGNVVREVRQDSRGNLWIGTEDAGLNMLDSVTGMFTHYQPTGKKEGLSYTNIHGLLVAGNELWIGTFEHGLDVMDLSTKKIIRHYGRNTGPHALNSNFIYCMYQLATGEIIAGTTTGAYLYNRRADYFTPYPGLPLNNWYSSFCQDKDGVLWAGTYGSGVFFYNTKNGRSGSYRNNPKNKASLCSNRVNGIFEDSDHTIWLATESGLCKYQQATNNFKRYTTADGFPSDFILSLLEDAKKNLWISTSKGLVCFDPEKGTLRNYSSTNGLLNDQFNFSSAFKDAAGHMYFGSVKGLIRFQPEAFIQNTFTPPVYITGLQVNNKDAEIAANNSPLQKSITETSNITLKHYQTTFSIDFAALSYTTPEMSEYAYKMEGLDVDWTYLKRNRKVYFTELAPGNYTFKVKAAASNGVWNEQETALQIEILPPFWRSNWAYALYTLLGFVIVMLLIRNYHKRTEEKNRRKIELLELGKEKEIFEAKINFFTNVAHEIKTPLTLIKGPLEKVIRKAAGFPEIKDSLTIMEKNTNRLIDLTNQLLDFRQTEIKGFSLNFVRTNISELLEDIYTGFKPLAEQKKLVFHLQLPATPVHAAVDVDAFNKIVSNLFSNAVKYADSKVYITLENTGNNRHSCTIEVKNDGYGIPYNMKDKIFEPFFRLKETEKQKGTGIGLALSLSLAQLHKGLLHLAEPENGMNVFCLILPLHQETETTVNYKEWKETPIVQTTSNR